MKDKTLKILIVEDSPTQATLLKKDLERHGMEVSIAENGVEALKQLKESTPDLIVSDIEMPKMNGYEFCQTVKGTRSLNHIPLILLTALTDPIAEKKGLICGANAFMTKPYDIILLVKKIASLTSEESRKVLETMLTQSQKAPQSK